MSGATPSRPVSTSLTRLIAWRALTHDRLRFGVTLIGIVFSVVLMGMQVGLLLNFINTTSILARSSNADIFITAPGVSSVDISTPQTERRRYQALSVPGVAEASMLSLDFALWKRDDGVRESTLLVGVDPATDMGKPWNMEPGTTAALLRQPDGVIIDRLYAAKLGVTHVGQLAEINTVRVRVVGFTKGIRTFTQSPYVFTSIEHARRIIGFGAEHTSYILIRAHQGVALPELVTRIQDRIPDSMVLTAKDFANNSSNYWLFTTGAGISLIMSAVLGLLVGGVIVAQTLYASTIDRLPEYATLRAMGSPPAYLYRIVLMQATMAACIGYTFGIALVAFLVWSGRNASAAPELPLWLAGCLGVNTLAVCLLAALVSLHRLGRIDPVSVFK